MSDAQKKHIDGNHQADAQDKPPQQKVDVDAVIQTTKQEIVKTINNSKLPPSIIEMILENLILQAQTQKQAKQLKDLSVSLPGLDVATKD